MKSLSAAMTDMADDATSSGYETVDDTEGSQNPLVVIGGRLADRYEILEVLGEGSFGTVCRCSDEYVGEAVAVKIVGKGGWVNGDEFNIFQNIRQWVRSLISRLMTAGPP